MKSLLRSLALLISCLLIFVCEVKAQQQRSITGTVNDATGQHLIGVTVRIKGTEMGTTTDANGKYHINVSLKNPVLEFSYIGYTAAEAPVTANIMNITMKATTGSLNEVVVVGYGTQKRVTVTGAISSVSGKELIKMPVSNVSNMLLGGVPGISGVQASGEPGRNSASIHIRGVSTFYSSNPLVV
ncbi:MAG: carboxypeptidase-like regulatory domain-containing protein, partial [Chitinophagaceae bacterium]